MSREIYPHNILPLTSQVTLKAAAAVKLPELRKLAINAAIDAARQASPHLFRPVTEGDNL